MKTILCPTSALSKNLTSSLPIGNCGVKFSSGLEFEQTIAFCNGLKICMHFEKMQGFCNKILENLALICYK